MTQGVPAPMKTFVRVNKERENRCVVLISYYFHLHQGGHVFGSFCMCVTLSINRMARKVLSEF